MAYYAISTDKPETNRRFAESLELDYPILSDPTKATARAYGVLMLGLVAGRQTIYIDPQGKILFIDRKVSPRSAGPDLARRLEQLGVAQV